MRAGLLFVLLIAGGCCPKPPANIRYVPQRVEVPVVAEVPEPPVFERRPLPIESAPADAPAREVIRLLVGTILQLQGEVEMRDRALDVYRHAPRSPTPAVSLPASPAP